MHLFEENIKNLELIIPEPPTALASYVPFKIFEFFGRLNCTISKLSLLVEKFEHHLSMLIN